MGDQMKIADWSPPNCPKCNADGMIHKCLSPAPGSESFLKNGWYCESCNSGPYQLGSTTESDAALFALRLMN